MRKERNWTLAGVGLEILAGLIMQVSVELGILAALIGAGFIVYGIAPNWCLQICESARSRLWPNAPSWLSEKLRGEPTPEIITLMKDIGRLKDMLFAWRDADQYREEFIERYNRLEESDSLVWQQDTMRLLRNDFLQRCAILFKAQSRSDEFLLSYDEIKEDKAEMKDFGEQLLAELRAYRGP